MTVVVNEAAVNTLLNSTIGPVGQHIGRLADQVATLATERASGPVIGIESGRLLAGIRTQLVGTPDGVRASVSTDAVAYDSRGQTRLYLGQPFSYPAFHDRNERPWLSGALAEVFQ